MFRKRSVTFLAVLCFISMAFLTASTLISQYHLEQVNELSSMQQESMDRDIEIIASQKGYIAELEECLEFLIPRIAIEELEVAE